MLSAGGLPTPLVVTRSGIRTCTRSTGRSRPASRRCATLSYHSKESATAARRLSPRHFRRGMAWPVSYYALLKWWLLLSQHPGCHRDPTSFATERRLGALVGGLGCFPLEREAFPPRSDSRDTTQGLRSWVSPGRREAPQTNSVALHPCANSRGWPSSHFGENELSPGLIRLSLLPTGPPPVFQHWWVRSSTTG